MPGSGPEHLSDEQLIAAIAGGHGEGHWRVLLERHQDRLYAVCARMVGPDLAHDLCQDSMVKIIQGLAGYDGSAKFTTWATRIAMNACLTHLRAAKLRRHTSLDAPVAGFMGLGSNNQDSGSDRSDFLVDREQTAPSRVQQSEAQALVSKALLDLDPDQRAIIVLRDVRGLDYDQIAEVLGIATGTVKSRLFRARAALREIIESMTPGDGPSSSPSSDQ